MVRGQGYPLTKEMWFEDHLFGLYDCFCMDDFIELLPELAKYIAQLFLRLDSLQAEASAVKRILI